MQTHDSRLLAISASSLHGCRSECCSTGMAVESNRLHFISFENKTLHGRRTGTRESKMKPPPPTSFLRCLRPYMRVTRTDSQRVRELPSVRRVSCRLILFVSHQSIISTSLMLVFFCTTLLIVGLVVLESWLSVRSSIFVTSVKKIYVVDRLNKYRLQFVVIKFGRYVKWSYTKEWKANTTLRKIGITFRRCRRAQDRTININLLTS